MTGSPLNHDQSWKMENPVRSLVLQNEFLSSQGKFQIGQTSQLALLENISKAISNFRAAETRSSGSVPSTPPENRFLNPKSVSCEEHTVARRHATCPTPSEQDFHYKIPSPTSSRRKHGTPPSRTPQHVCVRATAEDADMLGFQVTVLRLRGRVRMVGRI
ncbi:hypothetical protein R3P38DRAFT_2919159 [Favolaschia claudopus]|uniref:Uncharacterized protein n=1 Tax=Favolaschia claudopus TaxID=2862362 RepID=A0AAW0C0P0_9AGAR